MVCLLSVRSAPIRNWFANVTKLLNIFKIFIKYLHNPISALIFAVKF